MKKFLTILFIGLLNFTNNVFADDKILTSLQEGNKIIFIRHAIAPGNGDPENFNIKDCSTQRNLSENGIKQSKKIGLFFKNNKIKIDKAWAYILKCKEDNIVHTEIFFDPQTHTDRGIDFDIVINGIFNALKKAEKEFGLSFKIIMCFLRHLSEDECFKILDSGFPALTIPAHMFIQIQYFF